MQLTGSGYLHLPHGSMIGDQRAILDTGCPDEAILEPALFKRVDEKPSASGDDSERRVVIPKVVWNGTTYTNVSVEKVPKGENVIGLSFLARHRVVLDFPARKLYFKQTSVGPLPDQMVESFKDLLKSGRLPGLPKKGQGWLDYRLGGMCSAELEVHKENDPSVYHYKLVRTSFEAPWTVQHGWRTDKTGHTVEEYPAPQARAAK